LGTCVEQLGPGQRSVGKMHSLLKGRHARKARHGVAKTLAASQLQHAQCTRHSEKSARMAWRDYRRCVSRGFARAVAEVDHVGLRRAQRVRIEAVDLNAFLHIEVEDGEDELRQRDRRVGDGVAEGEAQVDEGARVDGNHAEAAIAARVHRRLIGGRWRERCEVVGERDDEVEGAAVVVPDL
jgi:hypothetical protein